MIRNIALMICFSLVGCVTTDTKPVWYIPSKPQTVHVQFDKKDGGYFIKENDATNLANNIDEMKAYEKKMEALVEIMSRFYGAKMEEYKPIK